DRPIDRLPAVRRDEKACAARVFVPGNAESPPTWLGAFRYRMFGGVLLSHTLSGAVPSALEGLASGFGMGPGVSPPLWPPKRRLGMPPERSGGSRRQREREFPTS